MQVRDVLKAAPIAEFLKTQLLNLILSCSHSSLAEPTVFMLMVMIVMFDDPHNIEAKAIRDQYWTMLRRRLSKMVEEKVEKGERMDSVETILPAHHEGNVRI